MAALVDLRTATAFTYTDSLTVYQCSSDTSSSAPPHPTWTQWFTAVVDGTEFPAQNSLILEATITETTTIYETYTFPELIVTNLIPGESIEMVISNSCKESI